MTKTSDNITSKDVPETLQTVTPPAEQTSVALPATYSSLKTVGPVSVESDSTSYNISFS